MRKEKNDQFPKFLFKSAKLLSTLLPTSAALGPVIMNHINLFLS